MDDPTPPLVRLSEPADVLSALPYLIGFHPQESVVVVALGGDTGNRVCLTARADLPDRATSPEVARDLARRVATEDPAGVVVAVVTASPDEHDRRPGGDPRAGLPHRGVVHDVVAALADEGIPVRDALLLRGGRWWSYDCPEPCCVPGAGTALPGGVPALAAASVAAGQVVARDRGELEGRIAPVDGAARAAMEAVTWRLVDRRAHAAREDPDAEARRSWDALLAALRRCGPGGSRLPDRQVAGVLWALADVRVRDRALGLALGEDAPAAELLWTECTRRAPAPLDAAPATLLAVSAWLRGDGAMAGVALQRALDSRPTYRLAQLLAEGLAACLPPRELRTLVTTVTADPDALWAAG
ncbi:DUF4192 domain-containing protein [Geodermatophilus sp. DSM 44513]|uniref:DUF4192 domain-containing protein n=1 Tax=Geodermatophilus sp. DSM 44513 TaxID=1528104 RepID=UPI001270D68C|nr:DUF4192 domain-containing protein [Geodermatophilus sp. DSM 44513]WNV74015.1 DUF4192 domain-containing protein [Geodermatophilus sp. DSM 44513]